MAALSTLAQFSWNSKETWVALLCLFITYRAGRFIQKWANIGWMPGYRSLFAPMSAPGALSSHNYFNLTSNWSWLLKDTSFFNWTHDIISVVPTLGAASYYVSSVDVAAQMLGNELQQPMHKPAEFAMVFKLWGDNLLTSEGEMWKRHRRVIQPTFNPNAYSLVMKEVTSIYYDILDTSKWRNETSVVAPDILYYTQRLAFYVIARCGFGLDMKWVPGEDEIIKETGITVADTLMAVLHNHFTRMIAPRILYLLPSKALAHVEMTWTSLAKYLNSSVKSRKEEIQNDPAVAESRHDMFTKLCASSLGLGKYSISDEEVIGNIFLMMFAGHETTGMVLSETVGYLAIYQEEQEKAYKEISSVIGTRDPTDEDLNHMPHTLACFVESARLFPPGSIVARVLPEDMVVKVKRPAPADVVLKKGHLINFDMFSIHRNPNDFPEPHVFRPSRWYNVPEPQLTMFGFGPRACIGRKFSHIEALTFLALILRDWHLDVVLNEGETRAEFEKRIMLGPAGMTGFTFGVTSKIPIRLTKRNA